MITEKIKSSMNNSLQLVHRRSRDDKIELILPTTRQ